VVARVPPDLGDKSTKSHLVFLLIFFLPEQGDSFFHFLVLIGDVCKKLLDLSQPIRGKTLSILTLFGSVGGLRLFCFDFCAIGVFEIGNSLSRMLDGGDIERRHQVDLFGLIYAFRGANMLG
jgi:hypothetical protein